MSRESVPAGWESLKELAISETGFLFNPLSGMTYQVNPTGRFILQQLQKGLSPGEIEKALQDSFDVEGEDLKRDILEFIYVLKKQELLRDT